jgi:hypothetical protein
MNSWHSLALGDGILASVAGEDIKQQFLTRPSSDQAAENAIFIRYDSGDLHCEVTAYFSPGVADIARHFGATVCSQPDRRGLELLAGSPECWDLLFAR